MVNLRRAESGDAAEMARIQVASLRERGDEYYDDEQLEHLAPSDHGPEEISNAVFESGDKYAVVAERDGDVAGFAVVHTDDGYLAGIFVDPSCTGEGIGVALLRNVETHSRRTDVKKLTTFAALNAVGFYDSCGFERAEKIDASGPEGPEIPAIKMEKAL